MGQGRVVVTGGSGKAGKWIVRELLDHGYDVLNLDNRLPDEKLCQTLIVDLNDLGQVHNALSAYGTRDRKPIEAVIHFAAIPQAFTHANDVTFRNNVMTTYNVLEAAANLGIRKAVTASSESSYGIVYASDFFSPRYLPVDEAHPQLPEDSYGLSKVVNELTGETFHRRTGMQVVSFRLGNILEPSDYARVIGSFSEPEARKIILWTYIDVRDVAAACRMAIEKDGLGAQSLILAADDTSSNVATAELIRRYLPDVKENRLPQEGRPALLSNERAKQLLGWRQQYFLQENAPY
ncbi:NAD-dependent epimerase/dehydratase family protein [Paenibacillus sp. MBLB4367]|uniref:NAD-dependent epimerase/dehydratase family protein n=1 Tax=Paenibacillus sp. MBLB4367 TaxID=3384767 RepID=UPI0039082B2B